ncbi:MAG: hypothetical protein LBH28_11780 [Oscillospiraceae bacterium]|jgi:hypothetical protein|nr:hypothetical protein [Oscillospiraceae bacterium]
MTVAIMGIGSVIVCDDRAITFVEGGEIMDADGDSRHSGSGAGLSSGIFSPLHFKLDNLRPKTRKEAQKHE